MEALLPLIITFGLMWALLIRPQQRRVREHQQLVATLSAGDEVITTGGIVGTIVSVVDDIVTLEVAPGTSIRLLRSAVQTRISADADDTYADGPYAGEIDDEDGLFDEDQFDAEPVAEPPAEPSAPPDVAEADSSSIPPPPPPSTPPTTPPPSMPPPTGEKT